MENKNRLKKWFEKWKWIVIWAIASVIFAIVIQLLFSNPAPCNFLDAKWEAGDILSYVSTVALGLLAMWQNQKMSYDAEKKEKQSRAIEKSIIFDFDEITSKARCVRAPCFFCLTGESSDFPVRQKPFGGMHTLFHLCHKKEKNREG